jgi:8-oxo-dGTP diphosphatase
MYVEKEIKEIFKKGHEIYLRNTSLDCVIFGFHENELKVLLLNAVYANQWALPGGFILREEHIDDAAKRTLFERTGLANIYMRQFDVFSEPQRSTKEINKQFLKNLNIEIKESWLYERFISIGYTALVEFTKVEPIAGKYASSCEWFSVNDIPDLILDHNIILKKALQDLRIQLNYHPVGLNLLATKFTMPELQKLYETILNRKLDRRNFQRKIISTGVLKKLNETKKDVAHKAPFLYKFDMSKYKKALKVGMGFEL